MTKKELIYEEAAKLFRDKGYLATSVRDLAEKVSLKPSSLYSHIGSKEEILQKICFDNAHRFVETMEQVQQLDINNVEKIKQLISLHIRIAIDYPTSATVFNDQWRHLSEPHLSNFLKLRKDYENGFLKIIVAGIEQQELKSVNPLVALYTLLTSVQWLHHWYRPERTISVAELEKNLFILLLEGLKY